MPVTLKGRKGDTVVRSDEFPRFGTTLETVAKLRPAFAKEGSVTAGNASGINDGAAAVVLMTADEAKRRGITPLARIVSWAHAGVDPSIMGTGPIPASRKALERAGWSVGDLDLVEASEAFAAQACAVNKDLGWDTDEVNVNGGAIALGRWRLRHPRLRDLAPRDDQARRQEGPRHLVHRRRHGHRHVRRPRLISYRTPQRACELVSFRRTKRFGKRRLRKQVLRLHRDQVWNSALRHQRLP